MFEKVSKHIMIAAKITLFYNEIVLLLNVKLLAELKNPGLKTMLQENILCS